MILLDQIYLEHWRQQYEAARAERMKQVDYYEGNQSEYLRQYLDLPWDDMPASWTNVTRRVIRKSSAVYRNPATRVVGEGAIQDEYSRITETKGIWMKETERRTNNLGVIAVRPVWDPVTKTFRRYHIVEDFRPYFTEADTINPSAIAYPINVESNAKEVWAYWDRDWHCVIDNDGEVLPMAEQRRWGILDPDLRNPLGVLPFVFTHRSPVLNDFWTPPATDLVNANEMINLDLTDLNYNIRYQSFKQMYTTGLTDADRNPIITGYKELPNLPDGATIDILDIQSDTERIINAIKFQMQLIERNYGLSIAWGMEGSPSGFSLLVQNIDLLEVHEDARDMAKVWEMELYAVERAIYKAETGRQLPEYMTVDLAEVTFPVNRDEEMAYWDWLIANGHKTRADYQQEKINPDLSPDEAAAEIEANLAQTRTNKQTANPAPTVQDILRGNNIAR